MAFSFSGLLPAAQAQTAAVPPVRADRTHAKPAPGKTGGAEKKPKVDPLQEAEKALKSAKTADEARSIRARAAMVRQHKLSAVARLMVKHADTALERHDFTAAEQAASDAIVLQPDLPVLWQERAQVRAAAGDFEGAIGDLAVALKADPGDVESWELLSTIEADRHDYKAAVDALDKAAVLDPHLQGAEDRREKLLLLRDGQPL